MCVLLIHTFRCESVVSIASALLKQSQAVTDQAVVELRQAHMEDGSLQVSVKV